ncbi:MAG: glycosyltransferase family 9 protein [Chitinophagaceae bacterium]|nr:glycosyltransferase family 9 protein [Chitinophagaceae bacterium]
MIPHRLRLDDIRKIAVLRSGALGDLLVTLPAIDAIRRAYPGAEIVLLGKEWQKEFVVKGRTAVDRVVTVPVSKGICEEPGRMENEQDLLDFFNAMKEESFDLAVNFQGDGKYSNSFIQKIEARFTVGTAFPNAQHPDRYVRYFYYQSELIRFVEIAGQIGALDFELEPVVHVLEKDREEVADLLQLLSGKAFIVLNPYATDSRRMWPLENYPQLADELYT